jgi:putative holin Dp-1
LADWSSINKKERTVADTGFTINPKAYDFLKYIALVVLPAVAALVLGLGVTLNWSGATGTAGVITLVDTFLGAILGRSATNYKAQSPDVFGDLIVTDRGDEGLNMRIVGRHENPVLEDKGQVMLNVRRETPLH